MILSILEKLKNESSTNQKQVILKENDNELFRKVLYYAYNPFYTFNIKKYPKGKSFSGEFQLEAVFDYLDKLRNREVTGNAAIDMVSILRSKLNERDAIVLDKILAKDMKVGINTKLINKVYTGLIPTINYMGAISFNKKKLQKMIGKKLYSEIKYDGLFCNLIFDENGRVETLARSGKKLFLEKAFEGIEAKNIVVTGEILVEGFHRYIANGLVNSLKQLIEKGSRQKDVENFIKNYDITPNEALNKIHMVAWDIIPLDKWQEGRYEKPLYERRKDLIEFHKINSKIGLVEYKEVSTYEEIMNSYLEAKDNGEEGIILKDTDSVWEDGKPNSQMKFKLEIELDLIITDLLNGNAGTKYENFVNRIVCETEDGKLKTTAGGIPEAMMNYLTENKDSLVGKVVTIKCSGISENSNGTYSVLHPRFVEVREDKDTPNTLNECFEIEESAKELN